ncbi:hypothetical protein BDQ17DRAFT_475442 [Cyathus striatus]|nr:hypothetical protein BDQ17DRAFT_475442 [Cyathus striatus]
MLSEYAKLQSLSLQYTYFPLCGDIVHSVIRAHSETLRNLDFTSCCFRPSARHRLRDLILTVSLCTQLSSLCLEVSKLDPWLLVVLSADLPNIESLRLNCAKIDLRLVGIWVRLHSRNVIVCSFWNVKHPQSLRVQTLRAWKLHDLSIFYRGKPLNNKTMKQISRHIPSVQSFWKTGDMDTPPAPPYYMQWKHSRFVLDLWRSAAYRPLKAGVDHIRWRLPF